MTRKSRKKRTQRRRIKTNSSKAKKASKKVKFGKKKSDSSYYKGLPLKDEKTQDHADDDDDDVNKRVYKKPKSLKVRGKDFVGNENEGQCRFQEANSSSEEESETINKTRKIIDEEKKENTKSAQKRIPTESEQDSLARSKEVVEKHAKKIKKSEPQKGKPKSPS